MSAMDKAVRDVLHISDAFKHGVAKDAQERTTQRIIDCFILPAGSTRIDAAQYAAALMLNEIERLITESWK